MDEKQRRTFLKLIGVASIGSVAAGEGAAEQSSSGQTKNTLPRAHKGWTPLSEDIRILNNTEERHTVSISARRAVASDSVPPIHESKANVSPIAKGKEAVAEISGVKFGGPGRFTITVFVDGKETESVDWFIPKHGIGSEEGEIPQTRRLVVSIMGPNEVELRKMTI